MGNDIKGNPTENPITDDACDKVQHMWWDHESFLQWLHWDPLHCYFDNIL